MSSLIQNICIFQLLLVVSSNALPQVKVENSVIKENGTTKHITKYSFNSTNSNATQDEAITKILRELKLDDFLGQDQKKVNMGGKKYRVYIKRKITTSRRPTKVSKENGETLRIDSYKTVDNSTANNNVIKKTITISVPKIVYTKHQTISAAPTEVISGHNVENNKSLDQQASADYVIPKLEQKGQKEVTLKSHHEVEEITEDVANYNDSTSELEETGHGQKINNEKEKLLIQDIVSKTASISHNINQSSITPKIISHTNYSLPSSYYIKYFSGDLNNQTSNELDSKNIHTFDIKNIRKLAQSCPECFGKIYEEMLQREKTGLLEAYELSTLELFKQVASPTLAHCLTNKDTENPVCKMSIPEQQLSSDIQQQQPQTTNYKMIYEAVHPDSVQASEAPNIEEDIANNVHTKENIDGHNNTLGEKYQQQSLSDNVNQQTDQDSALDIDPEVHTIPDSSNEGQSQSLGPIEPSSQNVPENSNITNDYVNQQVDYVITEEVQDSTGNINQQPNAFSDTVEPNQEDELAPTEVFSDIPKENTDNPKSQSPSSGISTQTYVFPGIFEQQVHPPEIDQNFPVGGQVESMPSPSSLVSQEIIHKPTEQIQHEQTNIPSSNSDQEQTYSVPSIPEQGVQPEIDPSLIVREDQKESLPLSPTSQEDIQLAKTNDPSGDSNHNQTNVLPGVTNIELQDSGSVQNISNVQHITTFDTINGGQLKWPNLPSSELTTDPKANIYIVQKPFFPSYGYKPNPYIVHNIPNQNVYMSGTGQNFVNPHNLGNLYYGKDSLSNNGHINYLFSINNLRRIILLLERRLNTEPSLQIYSFIKMMKLIMIVLRAQTIGDHSLDVLWFRNLRPDIQNHLTYYVRNLLQQSWLQTLMIRLHLSNYNLNILNSVQWTPYLLSWDKGLGDINKILGGDTSVVFPQHPRAIHYIHPPQVYHIIGADNILNSALKRSKRNY